MKNLSQTLTCLAWLMLALTGCEKHSDKEHSKNTATANLEKSSKTNLDEVTKPLLSEPEFDDPADGYFKAYLLIRESEKTENPQDVLPH